MFIIWILGLRGKDILVDCSLEQKESEISYNHNHFIFLYKQILIFLPLGMYFFSVYNVLFVGSYPRKHARCKVSLLSSTWRICHSFGQPHLEYIILYFYFLMMNCEHFLPALSLSYKFLEGGDGVLFASVLHILTVADIWYVFTE